MTIRNKLMGMAAVVLLMIATMAGFTYYRGDSMMRDQVDKAGMEIVQSAAANIDVVNGVARPQVFAFDTENALINVTGTASFA